MIHRELISDPTVTAINRLRIRGGGTFEDNCASVRRAMVQRSEARRVAEDSVVEHTDEWSESLDGLWNFRLLERPEDVSGDALVGGSTDEEWNRIRVPGPWTLQGPERVADGMRSFEHPHYTNVVMPFDETPPAVPERNPTGVYRRTVEVPTRWQGRRIVLRVGAAESVHQIFVDGRFVGGGSDSRLPSDFDLSDYARPGASIELAVVVTKWSAQTWLEDQDQWWHGGIQRSVSLYSVPQSHLAQVKLLPRLGQAEPDRNAAAGAGDRNAGPPERVGTLAAEVVMAGPAVTELGWTVELRVEELDDPDVEQPATLAATGPLPLPAWDSSSEAASLISAMFIEPGVARVTLDVPGITPWSHETPRRYRSVVIVRDPDGNEAHAHGAVVGFRSVEIVDNELLINGSPVLLHGVNLHEHDPDTGRWVTANRTRQDLLAMKTHNINAVRAAHYPHDEHLATLCDELGLYLVDEANVESHGRQASLCHDPRFSHSIGERVQRMAQRDQHHPSIIIWSLGNESGDGAVFDGAAAWLRRYDPTRPVQYEGPLMHDLYAAAPGTDVVCPMYVPIDDIVGWAESGRDQRRPLILCEYSHAMGNSNGSLSDYWAAFESTRGLQGGFIWEWLDHGLRLYDEEGEPLLAPNGEQSWGYGGDFEDEPNDFNFVCDGLVSADRIPRPAMAEVKHVGRPVRVGWSEQVTDGTDTGEPMLMVSNRRWFTGLEDLSARWTLTADGSEVASGELVVPRVEPQSDVAIPTPWTNDDEARCAAASEVFLDVEWSTREAGVWSSSGHKVGGDQLRVLADASRPTNPGSNADASEVTGARQIADDRHVADRGQNKGNGQAEDPGFDVTGLDWRPTVFRALTDNDGIRHGWMRGHIGNLARWVDELGLDRSDGPPFPVESEVTELHDGWARLHVRFRVPDQLTDLPRVGVEITLPADARRGPWERTSWFGDGPGECYPDRRASSTVGRWQSTVGEMFTNYALPQEHGHRTCMRWLSLERGDDGDSRGLLVVAGARSRHPSSARPGFGVRYQSDSELWGSMHSHELSAAGTDSITYLYLDAVQRGLGTASCGPDTLERYRIGSGLHVLDILLRGYDPDSMDPAELFARLVTDGEAGR